MMRFAFLILPLAARTNASAVSYVKNILPNQQSGAFPEGSVLHRVRESRLPKVAKNLTERPAAIGGGSGIIELLPVTLRGGGDGVSKPGIEIENGDGAERDIDVPESLADDTVVDELFGGVPPPAYWYDDAAVFDKAKSPERIADHHFNGVAPPPYWFEDSAVLASRKPTKTFRSPRLTTPSPNHDFHGTIDKIHTTEIPAVERGETVRQEVLQAMGILDGRQLLESESERTLSGLRDNELSAQTAVFSSSEGEVKSVELLWDWKKEMPRGIDWRKYLPKDFGWEKFLDIKHHFLSHLPKKISAIKAHLLNWKKFAFKGIFWKKLEDFMDASWSTEQWERLEAEGQLEAVLHLSSERPIMSSGHEWAEVVGKFFDTIAAIDAALDWRDFLNPSVPLQEFMADGHRPAELLEGQVAWRSMLPGSPDRWSAYIPRHFDWREFAREEGQNFLPGGLALHNELLPWEPHGGSNEYEWGVFLAAIFRWKELLPDDFEWHDLLPVGEEWKVTSRKQIKWDVVFQKLRTIPRTFEWQLFLRIAHAKLRKVFGHFIADKLPQKVVKLISCLVGLVAWKAHMAATKVEHGTQWLQTGAVFELLHLDPKQYHGEEHELDVAFVQAVLAKWKEAVDFGDFY